MYIYVYKHTLKHTHTHTHTHTHPHTHTHAHTHTHTHTHHTRSQTHKVLLKRLFAQIMITERICMPLFYFQKIFDPGILLTPE